MFNQTTARNMAVVINPPIMNVTFEHPTIIFDDKIAETIIEFVNHILFADSEETLRQIVADFADKYDLDRYFVYGYGSHHLWLYLKSCIINTFKVKNS